MCGLVRMNGVPSALGGSPSQGNGAGMSGRGRNPFPREVI
jgi:hypothetical protein